MLEIVGLNERNRWEEIVRQFAQHDVYYLPQYVNTFRIHGDGEPILFYYKCGSVKAMNVVMKRDISSCCNFTGTLISGQYFDLATPYGYGGFLIEGDGYEEHLRLLDEEYSAYCRTHNIVSEFVRFYPLAKNHSGLHSVYEISELGKTISMDLSSADTILENIAREKRAQIRKAEECGIGFCWGNDENLYAAFENMYHATMDRVNAKQYYYFQADYFNGTRLGMKDNALIFYAVLDGKTIMMYLVLLCNKRMSGHLLASDRAYAHIAPNSFLVYKIALWGCANGYESFHFGGGVGAQEDSLYRFKKDFNKKSDNTFAVGKKIFDREVYDYLVDLRLKTAQTQPDSSYFPLYRG